MNRTRLLLDKVAERHPHGPMPSREWIFAEEVRINTGFGPDRSLPPTSPVRQGWEQRIDAFAIHCWESRRHERVAYEVKATRQDLRRELDQPGKQDAALALSNLFYLVLDNDVRYNDLVLPVSWGVLVLTYPNPELWDGDDMDDWHRKGKLEQRRKAQWRNTDTPGFGFMLSLARRVHR